MLQTLMNILDQESTLHDQLLELMESEKKALLRSRPEALDGLHRDKTRLLQKIDRVGRERRAELERMAARLGCPSQEITLTRLMAGAPAAEAGRVENLRRRLKTVTGRIRSLNRRNRQLIQHSLGVIRGSLALLNQLMSTGSVYHRSGTVAPRMGGGRMLSAQI